MTDEFSGLGGPSSESDDLIEIDLNFESMRRFQAEFSPNLSKDGLFIDTGEPLGPGSVVRFRVILPEDFVFLEGTAVVEWKRSAEAISDGPPGMALRFVTLSPQNQELVEQLVQDYIGAGGTPFDFDVRPEITDFPTDALEGAPVDRDSAANEGYRLTVRGAGAGLEAEALQALVDAAPHGEDESIAPSEDVSASLEEQTEEDVDVEADSGDDAAQTEEPRGFEIVSKPAELEPEVSGESDLQEGPNEPPAPEDVGEPPDLDWSVENEALADEPTESPDVVAAAVSEISPPVDATAEIEESPINEVEIQDEQPSDDDAVMRETEEDEASSIDADESHQDPVPEVDDYDSSITEVLDVPEEFAEGPEVIEEVEEEFGSPAFDVSLPEPDDEPDTTPVMPDEGWDDVTVATDDEDDVEPPRRRRLWPFGLAAALILAIAAGFLSPQVKTWLESRGERPSATEAEVTTDALAEPAAIEPVQDPEEVSADDPAGSEPETPATEAEGEVEQSVQVADVAGEPVAQPETPAPEPVAEVVSTNPATAIESIEVEPGSGGTIVSIRGNGNLGDGAVSMENLSSPPRVLVRLRGIQSVYRPYTIESATGEVTRARIGHHEDRRPPELWVVLDLTVPEAEIGGIDIQGDRVEFVIKSR